MSILQFPSKEEQNFEGLYVNKAAAAAAAAISFFMMTIVALTLLLLNPIVAQAVSSTRLLNLYL